MAGTLLSSWLLCNKSAVGNVVISICLMRKPKHRHVKKLARDPTAGEWQYVHGGFLGGAGSREWRVCAASQEHAEGPGTHQAVLMPLPALPMLERTGGCTSVKGARERLKGAVSRMDNSQGDGWAQQTEEVSLG